jgi:Ca2+-binding EF-hand superfamily protein
MDQLSAAPRPMAARSRRLYSAFVNAPVISLSVLLLALTVAPMVAAQSAAGRVFVSPSGEPFRPSAAAPDPFEAWFARVDADHDGRIDRDEFRADAAQFFQRLDTNHDGVIDGFEVAAYEQAVAPELAIDGQGFASDPRSRSGTVSLLSDPEPVSGADTDLNSHISLAEWQAAADRRFDLLDPKHNGFLTHDALAALLPKARKP